MIERIAALNRRINDLVCHPLSGWLALIAIMGWFAFSRASRFDPDLSYLGAGSNSLQTYLLFIIAAATAAVHVKAHEAHAKIEEIHGHLGLDDEHTTPCEGCKKRFDLDTMHYEGEEGLWFCDACYEALAAEADPLVKAHQDGTCGCVAMARLNCRCDDIPLLGESHDVKCCIGWQAATVPCLVTPGTRCGEVVCFEARRRGFQVAIDPAHVRHVMPAAAVIASNTDLSPKPEPYDPLLALISLPSSFDVVIEGERFPVTSLNSYSAYDRHWKISLVGTPLGSPWFTVTWEDAVAALCPETLECLMHNRARKLVESAIADVQKIIALRASTREHEAQHDGA